MTTRYDYALLEFTANLAEAEANYGEKLQSIIDTFSQSRLDLPLKRLSEIAKMHGRASQNLKKYMDSRKNEHLNLWKMCNIYSCCAVDLDKAMRDTRASLRTKMAIDGTVIEKPKRKNLFNSILTNTNLNSNKSFDVANSNSNSNSEKSERRWFPKLSGYERKAETRTSRKNTSTSLEPEKDERVLTGSKSTPPTPPVIRPHAVLKASASVAAEPLQKITRAPPPPPEAPVSPPPPPPPVSSPPQLYATPIYGDLQKASLNNNKVVAEHSLRHTDDVKTDQKTASVVRIRTDVDVSAEARRNETTVNVYDSPARNHYVNIRPPIAQKPRYIYPDQTPSPRSESDVAPTFISVECYQSTVPVPSPRSYFNSSDTPSSQRSSSSAYSSNFSSSSNVTSLVVEDVEKPHRF